MDLSGFADYITPIDKFFVRTHVYAPTVNVRDWRLRVEGEVTTPLTLTMEDLRKLPSREVVAVLECAGNGRAFFDPPVPGIQWMFGAVGNGRWRGVRLGDVLRRAGIKESAVEVLFDGADVPLGTMPDFQRGIPIKKALDPDTLLAYEMNGEPLPMRHGAPLRAIVPGWAGDSWSKWITSIRVLDREFDGFWMKSGYRYPNRPGAPGQAVPADATHPVQSLKVKSLRYSSQNGMVRGVAWSGEGGPVTQVRLGGQGRGWITAKLYGPQTRYGWRQWECQVPDNTLPLFVQAEDRSGAAQPLLTEWNPSGYLQNAVYPGSIPGIKSVHPDAPSSLRGSCMTCHGAEVVQQQRLTRDQWNREIDKMVGWGAQVKPEDRAAILDFLVNNFGR
jgi:DMSO/TMAO reductase YedYZ molybdopterin-dependent catalytic subunit